MSQLNPTLAIAIKNDVISAAHKIASAADPTNIRLRMASRYLSIAIEQIDRAAEAPVTPVTPKSVIQQVRNQSNSPSLPPVKAS